MNASSVIDTYALSPLQEGLLFHRLLDGSGSLYLEQSAFTVEGEIDLEGLEAAIGEVCSRHDSLHTVFAHEGLKRPVQIVHRSRPFRFETRRDLSGLPAEDQARAIGLYQSMDRERGFDLSRGPLLRVAAFRLGPRLFRMVWSFHHIIMDGWCLGLLIGDLFNVYGARSAGGEPAPYPAPRYRPYIDWIKSRDEAATRRFWAERFAGFGPAPRLPAIGGDAKCAGQLEVAKARIPAPSMEAIRAKASAWRVTPNHLMQAAWSVLVGRYCGARDVSFGVVVSGRPAALPGAESIIGLFINSVPRRVSWDEGDSLRTIAERVRDAAAEEGPHEHASLAAIQGALGRNDLVGHIFIFENYPGERNFGGYSVRDFDSFERTNYPLAVEIAPDADEQLSFKYDAGVYGRPFMESLLGAYLGLLGQADGWEGRAVSRLELRGARPTPQATPQATPREWPATVLEAIWRNARERPRSPAVQDGAGSLDYGRLWELSGRAARSLASMGVGPSAVVAVRARHGADLVCAVLGVLRAGAAYLPVDPSCPPDRLAYILEDSGAVLLLGDAGAEAASGAPTRAARYLDIASLAPASSDGAEADGGPPMPGAADAAYVIYTSGSTGVPKGVCVEHGNLASYIESCRSEYTDGAPVSMPFFTSIGFDLTVTSVFLPLCSGGRVLAIEEDGLDRCFARMLGEASINFIKLTPAHLRAFCSLGLPCDRPITFIVGGEALASSLCVEALALAGEGSAILNEYGPTEATVGCVTGRFDPARDTGPYAPIGRPLPNARIRIVDAHGAEQPLGAVGEIEISGACVARGYLGEAPGSGTRFSAGEGGRRYLSGDLGRMLADGTVEYLGRADGQVKIRGYRIEPAEVERAIAACPGVGQAAVRAFEDGAGDRYLCAYLVPESADADAVLALLARTLPPYMVPSRVVRLPALPLNRNGKIDRAALAEPQAPSAGSAVRAPAGDDLERAVLAAAGEALGRQPGALGMDDDFFAEGGDSLKAIRYAGALKRATGREAGVRDAFRFRTPRAMATALRGRPRQARVPMAKADERDFYPATYAQEQMYILRETGEGGAEYNVSGGIFIAPWADEAELERMLNGIVARHESLRTAFEMRDGRLVQRIRAEARLALEEAGRCSIESAADLARAWVRPFDLSQAPLFRAAILRVDDGRRILLLDMHHIVSDGYSLGLIVSEVAQSLGGREIAAPAYRYRDYAVWQRESWDPAPGREYWLSRHGGKLAELELRSDHTDGAARSSAGFNVAERLGAERVRRLETMAAGFGLTLSMALMAAFYLMLWKESGSGELVVGTPVAGRNQGETERVVGLFMNTVAVRLGLNRFDSVKAALERLRDELVDAFEHGEYPLETLLRDLDAPRVAGRNLLFNTMYVWQEESWTDLAKLGEGFSEFSWADGNAKLDISLEAVRDSGSVRLRFGFASRLWDDAGARRFADRYLLAVDALMGDPAVPLGELQLLSQAELAFLERAEFGHRVPYRPEGLAERLAATAAGHPTRTAILWENAEIPYGTLAAWTSRLAARILSAAPPARGAGREAVVAVLCSRGPGYVASCLGVFWAGLVYLPLDPKAPEDRLAYQLSDSRAACLLFDEDNRALAGRLASGGGIALAPAADDPAAPGAPMAAYDPRRSAYLIYTSGSTGRPKGVSVELEGLSSLMAFQTASFGMVPGDRVLQFSTMVFDASVWELAMWLAAGACLCMGPEDELFDGDGLAALMRDKAVTVATLTPSFLRMLDPSRLSGLRLLVSAGSELDPRLAERFRGATRLVNGYGPTETTVCAATHEVPGTGALGPRVPIGRPMANARVRILGKNGAVLPPGATGEIEISGVLVARGYLNRPDLTAASFGELGGVRCYRSGDRGRWLPDETLEYGGRLDGQIKIRGNRVELGEIEQVLASCAGVADCAVRHVKAEGGEGYLCAYVRPSSLDPEALYGELRRALPSYMIPARVVALDAFPINRNGKVDYAALPLPGSRDGGGSERAAPRDGLEEAVLAAAAAALEIDGRELGMGGDFFARGGDSLRAIRYAGLLKASTGRDANVRDVFQFRTPVDMATALRGRPRLARRPDIARADERPYYPVTYSQERMFVLRAMGVAGTEYNVYGGCMVPASVSAAGIERALAELIRRHESLRTSFRMEGAAVVQIIHEDFEFSLEDLGQCPAGEALDRARAWVRPFDLGVAPLFRAGLLSRDDGRRVLLLDMHHIVSDGVSLGLIVGELAEALSGRVPRASGLRYRDYAVWQREVWDPEESGAYWLERYADPAPALELGTDRPRPAVQDYRGGTVSLQIGAEASAAIERAAASAGATVPMAMMAAYYLMLWKNSGQDDIVIGTPVAGRSQGQSDGLVGLFVNTVPVRFRMRAEESLSSLLARLRDELVGAYEHGEYPLELLIERAGVRRDAGRNPLFDALFVWQERSWGDMSRLGDGFEGVSWSSGQAKFDLTLLASRNEGGIGVALDYASSLWDEASARGLLDAYGQAVALLAGDCSTPAGEVSLLGPGEADFLASIGSGPIVECEPRTLAELLHGLALADGARVALRWRVAPGDGGVARGDGRVGTLSYAELAGRCASVARSLDEARAARGWGREPIVAVLASRGHGFIAGALGVFWAGMAYLPLDAGSPDERLAFQLTDSGAACLLCDDAQSGRAARLAAAAGSIPVLPIAKAASGDRPPEPFDPDRLAYVIYTSGSTGKPKGVAVEWRGLPSFGEYHRRVRALGAGDRVLQFSNPAFDASIDDLAMWLYGGGELCLATEEELLDADGLRALIADLGVTVATLPPPYLRGVGPDAVKGLRLAICAGSELDGALAAKLAGHARVMNGYGPTEATICAASCDVSPLGIGPGRVPIGRPLPNVEIRIVDACGRPVPLGAVGEIELAGIGLARGYLNRPELTAERFPVREGKRRYLSGDLGRWRRDGNIEYLGRRDGQVKIRGYRVETSEVEAAIKAMAGVRDAVVSVLGRAETGQTLVAYAATGRDAASLRAEAARVLPPYMVPSRWAILGELPLNRNGKVDRAALLASLPAPEASGQDTDTGAGPEGKAAADETEALLAAEAAAVLGLASIPVDANFFEAGGDSIRAIQLCARLRARGLELEVRDIFANPTVEGMRRALKRGPADDGGAEDGGDAVLVPIQEWFFRVDGERVDHFNQSVVLERDGGFDPEALRQALGALVAGHSALRQRFSFGADGRPLSAVEIGEPDYAFELADGDDEGRAIAANGTSLHRSMDVRAGRLVAARLYRGSARDRLQLAIHHLAVDVVSWNSIIGELSAYYSQAASGGRPSPRRERVPWRSWSRRVAALSDADLARDAGRHRERFLLAASGKAPPPEAPGDWASSEALEIRMPAESVRRLRAGLRKSYGVGLRDGLLATLARALSRARSSDAAVIDVESHGRDALDGLDVSGSVGWFTVIFPVALDFGASPGWDSAVESLSRQFKEAPLRGLAWMAHAARSGCAEHAGDAGLDVASDILFNYTGESGGSVPVGDIRVSAMSDGTKIDPLRKRSHAYEANLSIGPDGAVGELRYAGGAGAAERASAIMEAWREAVLDLAEHCESREIPIGRAYTKKGVDAAEREAIMAALRRAHEG